MKQWPPSDLYVEAKLLGILLSGVFGQTRPDCSAESRLRLDAYRRQRIATPDPQGDPEC